MNIKINVFQGIGNRQTGATNMNEQSSRSHSIFQIVSMNLICNHFCLWLRWRD